MIAIAGGKGGCGKTTTTLGLARGLLERGIGVRAVDLDRGMPDLHRVAGVDREPTLAAATDGDEVDVVQRDESGVGIAAAPRATASLDVERALDAVDDPAEVTLVDSPAGAGPDAVAPVRLADAAILVTTGRRQSVADAAKTGRMARSLGVPVLGAVVTRSASISASVRAELATERTVAVPHARKPLADRRVDEAYGAVAGWVVSWRDRRRSRSRGAGTPCGRDSAVRAEDPRPGSRKGRHASTGSGAESAATGPRDRRSRRSRAPGGTGSSSRGGGAPSGRR